jgi:microcystin-dependent protein
MGIDAGYGIGSLKPGVCTSSTRPTNPFTGQTIYETDTLLAKVWTGSAWVDYPQGKANTVSPTFTGNVVLPSTTSIGNVTSVESLVPVGVISAYAGVSAPSGWLMCAGQAVSRSTYAALFTALSTTYGVGDGSTTFNLPDLRGRVPAGVDNMGGSAASRLTSTVLTASNTLGATGGTQTHTLTEAQMPSHTHIQNQHSHPMDFDPIDARTQYSGTSTADSTVIGFGDATVIPTYWAFSNSYTFGATRTALPTNQTTGSGSAHPITQPTLVLNYIIKATQ